MSTLRYHYILTNAIRLIFGLVVLLVVNTSLLGQDSPKEIRQQADIFYDYKKYGLALNYYQQYTNLKKGDDEVLLRTAICLYQTNNVDQAQQILTGLLNEPQKINPSAYLYLAKTYHATLDFKKAIKNYKQYLAKVKENNPDRPSVRDAIRRCANGLKLDYQEKRALVENLGEKVNSRFNDFAPVVSPNFANKLYFSSARSSSIGGLRDAEGKRDNTLGAYSSDMYYTTIVNGEWTETTPMSALLNTPRNDVILDFNADGSVLFFYKGYNLYSGEIFVDTFGIEREQLFPPTFKSPLLAGKGDGRPDFFQDSILIFDSRRKGGFGGSDLYYMVKGINGWAAPQNMGAAINTAYDETTPFVAADGHTLYFSSNDSRKSIGGMDIFKSMYDHTDNKWSKPINIGIPINSAEDDLFFSLSQDGLQGYFSSNRKESLGGNDIFVAYFKEEQAAQKPASEAPFSFVEKVLKEEGKDVNQGEMSEHPSNLEKKTYEIEPLYYIGDTDVLNPQNIDRLNQLILFLKENPMTTTLLSCHSDNTSNSKFELFFAIKRAEQTAEYLVQNDIQPNRILLKGIGGNYPIAQGIIDDAPNEMGQQLNRRIDIKVYGKVNQNNEVLIKKPQVSQFMANSKGSNYQKIMEGLSYKIQIGALKQMYKGDLLQKNEDPLIERDYSQTYYQYTIGLFTQYSEASQLQKELYQQGYKDTFIVPYINAQRISLNEALKNAALYPDLLNFIEKK